ncbi:hypothetical protein GOHSU_06_00420 [Gordonia hirsuta DSM 44140 = NBRC 16056]|uniref:Uncharacterized protein n=1 Tax=Gordonia hirsuta DSM 44140 = NBRC 16056 TaxID=1121927 RepID=L7L5L4_9ACTN|nr:hypothetical protein GOHSU_06_00420 [Gordonia hirsuta DSM 44140 = NBRC 16056]
MPPDAQSPRTVVGDKFPQRKDLAMSNKDEHEQRIEEEERARQKERERLEREEQDRLK